MNDDEITAWFVKRHPQTQVVIGERAGDVGGGELYVVRLTDQAGETIERYAHFQHGNLTEYKSGEELLRMLKHTRRESISAMALRHGLAVGGIPGVLAFLLVGSACFVLVMGRPIPDGMQDFLTSAVMLVLGFYFGTAGEKYATMSSGDE